MIYNKYIIKFKNTLHLATFQYGFFASKQQSSMHLMLATYVWSRHKLLLSA